MLFGRETLNQENRVKESSFLILFYISFFSRFSRPFNWYFTSQNGEIIIKESEKIIVNEIQTEFTGIQSADCPIVATLILPGLSKIQSKKSSICKKANKSTSLFFEHFNESNLSIDKKNISYIIEKSQ